MSLLTIDINMPESEFDLLEAAEVELLQWEDGDIKGKDLTDDRKTELRKLRRYIKEELIGSRIYKHVSFIHKGVAHRGYTVSANYVGSDRNAGRPEARKILAKFQDFAPNTFIWQAWTPKGHVGTEAKRIPVEASVNVRDSGKIAVRSPHTITVYDNDPEWIPPAAVHPGYITETNDKNIFDEDGNVTGTVQETRPIMKMSWRGRVIKEPPPRA